MSVTGSVSSMNLEELLGDFIPGSLLIIGIVTLFNIDVDILTGLSSALLFVLLVLAYATGHFIQMLNGYIDSPPDRFNRGMKAIDEERYEDVPFQVTEIEKNFLSLCRKEFNLSDGYQDYGSLFEMLQSFLKATPMNKGLRFQAYFSLMWAIETTAVLLAMFSLGGISLYLIGVEIIRDVILAAAIFVVCIIAFVFAKDRRDKFEKNWVEYVILDVHNYFEAFNQRTQTDQEARPSLVEE